MPRILNSLADDGRVSVLFGVDANEIGTLGSKSLEKVREAAGGEEILFDYIIFNFPHTGCGVKDTVKNNAIHHAFLCNVAEQSKALLRPHPESEGGEEGIRGGELHITLKRGSPYDDWRVAQAGRAGGLSFKTAVEFFPHLYAGYEHRRVRRSEWALGHLPCSGRRDRAKLTDLERRTRPRALVALAQRGRNRRAPTREGRRLPRRALGKGLERDTSSTTP